MILNSPIYPEATSVAVSKSTELIERMCKRIKMLDSHIGLFFLTHYTSAPRLNYLLRTAPLYLEPEFMQNIDTTVRETAISVTNVAMDNSAWSQASLPVRYGGLGLRSVASLALPCYLSSAHKALSTVKSIIKHPNLQKLQQLNHAESHFQGLHPHTALPNGEAALRQKSWDELTCKAVFNNLTSTANQVHSARLLAAAAPHSGAWLQALPCPTLGLHLDEETTRIAVALRVGAQICEPHRCRCGSLVDTLGHHGLSCGKSAGRNPRHHYLNDVVKRSLHSAGIPSWLEPVGLDRGDGKRPDGLTCLPFTNGKNLCWDATCTDTFCKSAIAQTALTAGAAANKAEGRKTTLYSSLSDRYRFEPLAIETTGVLGNTSARFVAEIGRRITLKTGEKRETAWLRQRLSIAVVRGNAASILATGKSFGVD